MAVNLIDNEEVHVIQDGSDITLDIQADALKNDNVVVGSIRSKNIFGNYVIVSGWISDTRLRVNSTYTEKLAFISCKPNTTYTISKSVITSRFRIGEYTTIPSSTNQDQTFTIPQVNNNDSETTLTYTTSNTAKYLIIEYANTSVDSSSTIEGCLKSMQVEEGDTATAYSPYQNLTGEENYSTEEQVIGTYLGKPLYRKVITRTINANTNDNVSLSTLGITNQDTIIINTGLSTAHYQISTTGGGYAPIVYYVSNTDRAHVYVNANKELQIQNQNTNQREYNIVLEYTKTTD